MTGTDSATKRGSTDGSVTLVSLPAEMDLTDSGILTEIGHAEDVAALNLLAILYDRSPDDWAHSALHSYDSTPAELGIVSVGDTYRSATAQSSGPASGSPRGARDEQPLEVVTPVRDPIDLVELGMAISRYLDAWHDTDGQTVVVFDSLNDLLQEVDTDDALQFLHILRHRITSANSVGYFLVHPELHDTKTISILRTLFDEEIECGLDDAEQLADIEEETVLEALIDGTRREIVDHLTTTQSISRGELGIHLMAAGVSDDQTTIDVGLYHLHLPKLADVGLVSYDRETGKVELAIPEQRVHSWLERTREETES